MFSPAGSAIHEVTSVNFSSRHTPSGNVTFVFANLGKNARVHTVISDARSASTPSRRSGIGIPDSSVNLPADDGSKGENRPVGGFSAMSIHGH